jgi:hypothetical protein
MSQSPNVKRYAFIWVRLHLFRGSCTWVAYAFIWVRLHLFRGSCTWVAFSRCVEPLSLLEGLAVFRLSSGGSSSFLAFRVLLVVLIPLSLLEGYLCVYLVASSRCPCLWGPSFAHFKWPSFGFSLVFGHLVELLVLLFFFFFCSSCLCIGVDNALIKGEITNIMLTSTLVWSFCDEWLSMWSTK